MIDLTRESPVTFAAAPQVVPAINAVAGMEARPVLCERTIYNWATKGKRGVILESAAMGGILVTSREALQRFFSRVSAAREEKLFQSRNPQEKGRGMVRRPRISQKRNEQARSQLLREHGV